MHKLICSITSLSIVMAFIVLSACAVDPDLIQIRQLPTDAEVEQYNASVVPEDRIVCRKERPVTSNILKRVCRYVRDVEETSAFHREQLRQVLR